jgi:hypothetical protein
MCGDGVPAVINAVNQIEIAEAPVSAFFNAGFSEQSEGRHLFLASPEYLADSAVKLAKMGVRLIGGCCGTNPLKYFCKYKKTLDILNDLSSCTDKNNNPEYLLFVVACTLFS